MFQVKFGALVKFGAPVKFAPSVKFGSLIKLSSFKFRWGTSERRDRA